MNKNRGAAIIPYKESLIVIKRIKGNGENKKIYYTIPGGVQEKGETIEETTIREIEEELGIEVKLTDKCYEIKNQNRKEYFFVAKYKSGQVGTGKGEEMSNIDYEKYGEYIPEMIKREDIKNIELLPREIKEIILKNINEIFDENI